MTPRRGRLEREEPERPRQDAASRAAPGWRVEVARLLATLWDPEERWRRASASSDLEVLADAVVGMFDAGARDAEVAAFLRGQEEASLGAPAHEERARLALTAALHRAAKLPPEHPSPAA